MSHNRVCVLSRVCPSVQKQSIPVLLDGRDALVRSQTGSGQSCNSASPRAGPGPCPCCRPCSQVAVRGGEATSAFAESPDPVHTGAVRGPQEGPQEEPRAGTLWKKSGSVLLLGTRLWASPSPVIRGDERSPGADPSSDTSTHRSDARHLHQHGTLHSLPCSSGPCAPPPAPRLAVRPPPQPPPRWAGLGLGFRQLLPAAAPQRTSSA